MISGTTLPGYQEYVLACGYMNSNGSARRRLNRFLQYHKFKKPPCEICGLADPAFINAHHEDYSKPFHVRWLCIKHHRMVHAGTLCLIPIEIVPAYDLVSAQESMEIVARLKAQGDWKWA